MLEYRPGETVGQHYNRLVDHARKLDPRFVGGVASVPEMDRVKKAIVTLEKQAEEKARRQRSISFTPALVTKGRSSLIST
jgi:hypothetical protein